MKNIAFVLISAVSAVAMGSSTVQTFVTENTPVPAGSSVGFSAGGSSGVRDNLDGTYPPFGTSTFTWSRTNTTGSTVPGYTETSTVADPTYPNVAYFPNPATVTWMTPTSGGPTGPGE